MKKNTDNKKVLDFIKINNKYIIAIFMLVLYIVLFIDLALINYLEHSSVKISLIKNIFIIYFVSGVISIVIFIGIYKATKGIRDCLCYNVLVASNTREQYERYEKIKECIEHYKNKSGKCDIQKNVNVIYASLAFDNAKCIVYPILLTALGFIFPDSSSFSSAKIIIGVPLLFLLGAFTSAISRNEFIKRVADSISEEHSLKKER